MFASNTVQDLLSVPVSERKTAYREMRASLESDWIHVSPSALRNRFAQCEKLAAAGGYRKALSERNIELIQDDRDDYDRKAHIKHLMAVLAGNYDTILLSEKFEFTVRYSTQPEWNKEAADIAAHRILELTNGRCDE